MNKISIASLIIFPCSAFSGELTVLPSISTTGYLTQTQLGEESKDNNVAIAFQPKLVSVYDSKKVDVSLSLEQTLVRQNDEGGDKNFTDASINSMVNIIDKTLLFSVVGNQSYRALNQGQDLFSDKLLASGDLSKVKNYSSNLMFTLPNPKYFGLNLTTGYSETSSEQSLDSNNGLDSSNILASSRLYSGRRLQIVTFDFSANYNKSDRTNLSEFESTSLNGNVKFKIFDKLRFVLTGRDEQYNFDENSSVSRPSLDTTSYGAGLGWYARDDRFFQLTYNTLEEGDNTNNFVGFDMDWAFSQRTSLSANYGKRFYGDAYALQFDYKMKYLKSSLRYSEDITTFARLSQSTNSLGLFVCELGASDFSTCFQPQELNYELQPGEQFITYNETISDITDEVILSKSARYELAYDKRKIKISFNLGYQQTEYLETNRLQKYKTAGVVFNYDLSRKTNISLNTQLINRETTDTEQGEDTHSITLSGKHSLSRNADVDLSFRWLDRNSENELRDATDKRLTLGFTYSF
ncbi:MAG: TIGR03016 family PEP-CTERM system-associated outer membrane protein [Paraglaciecola sp.]|uniref:TIGR03016 family PEP-CTERM system-associated outer membrane protein n=1 Tax=Paraglaciecola sp. TaxID=1920173 RepID=UPI00273E1F1D|nr:TIGR03016 family PEP-CTERM system-associated outer membrane protein [Paraglaciecola sp.]MDP5029785.1 TIGR03016 family PEP-CTERM system-associated outer membrane protein [Paraglaciecola sp.]MDP5131522.1 TIGR03016 family PEP-CTERM system-associated outer membrane protein [Paraglaciecola sp.]